MKSKKLEKFQMTVLFEQDKDEKSRVFGQIASDVELCRGQV